MTIYALEGFAEQWYTPDGQGGEPQTRFRLKPLDGEQFTNLQLMLDGMKMTGEAVAYALRVGLVDWEHVSRPDGSDLAYSLANQRLLPMPVRIDLASKIYEISLLSGEQVKNY